MKTLAELLDEIKQASELIGRWAKVLEWDLENHYHFVEDDLKGMDYWRNVIKEREYLIDTGSYAEVNNYVTV